MGTPILAKGSAVACTRPGHADMQQKATSNRPQLNVPQVAGGALAAVTSAVVASRFGLGGTLIGAALASVVSTIGATLYSHTIRRTGSKMRDLIEEPSAVARRLPRLDDLGLRRTGEGKGNGSGSRHAPPAPHGLQRAEPATRNPPPGAWRKTGAAAPPPARRIPLWAVTILASVVVFLVALGAVTGIEGLVGRPLSSVTGGSGTTSGTTLGGVTTGSGAAPAATPTPQPANPTTAPTEDPGTEPSSRPQQQPAGGSTPEVQPSSAPEPSQPPSTPQAQPSAGAPGSP
jgi:hypothetical protein